MKYFDIFLAIALGFFTGILVNFGARDVADSGIHILLASIFWLLVMIYLRIPLPAHSKPKEKISSGAMD